MKLWMVSTLFLLSSVAWANKSSILQAVDTRFDGSTFVAELQFDKAPAANDILIEYINQTIQVNMPNSTVKTGKILQRVNQENIKSVYSYQFDKNLMRTRIIYNKPIVALDYEGFVKVEKNNNSILIFIYDPVMAKTANEDKANFEIVPPLDIEKEMAKTNKKDSTNVKAEDIVAQELSIPKVLPEKVEAPIVEKKLVIEEKPVVEKKLKPTVESAQKENGPSPILAENQIPLFKNKETVKTTSESSLTRLLMSLFIVIVLSAGL
ncbi:MAG: hypothetical protein KDD40_08305, partial [Bdellovibrionales bacterium]|nr:hypothetical protein [Bdellovibrionales bacterium]